jgi:hypothetical protein
MDYEQYLPEIKRVLQPDDNEFIKVLPMLGESFCRGRATDGGAWIRMYRKMNEKQLKALPESVGADSYLIYSEAIDLKGWDDDEKAKVTRDRMNVRFSQPSFVWIKTLCEYRYRIQRNSGLLYADKVEIVMGDTVNPIDGYFEVWWGFDFEKWFAPDEARAIVFACKHSDVKIFVEEKEITNTETNRYYWNEIYSRWDRIHEGTVLHWCKVRNIPDCALYDPDYLNKRFEEVSKPHVCHIEQGIERLCGGMQIAIKGTELTVT